MNNYFNNVGKDLADNIVTNTQLLNIDLQENHPQQRAQVTTFEPTTSMEIYKTVMTFKNESAPGQDNLQTKTHTTTHTRPIN